MSLLNTINKVCRDLPDDWTVMIVMERSTAFVECYDDDGGIVILPDSADKTLQEELHDALQVAIKHYFNRGRNE